jgi:hypothetical protein
MTPEERELIADLFNRLAPLEREPRDPEAERTIREGLMRAPNAVYALVQSVLVQDEALKAADKHIADLEDALQAAQQQPQQKRGFLDNMRDSILGRDEAPASRGSVPSVGDRPVGAPAGDGSPRPDPWGQARQSPQYRDQGGGGGGYGAPQGGGYGAPQGGGYGAPQGGPPMGSQYGAPGGGGGGGSFLGTAAAAAAGAIGGGLLMGGIRSAMGGHAQSAGSPFGGTFDQLARGGGGSAAGGELSRDAGLNDIGRSGGSRFSQAEADRQQDADQDQDDEQDADQDQDDEQDAADFDSDDSGDSDTA